MVAQRPAVVARRPTALDGRRRRVWAALASAAAFGLGIALPRSRPGRALVRAVAVGAALGGVVLGAAGRSRDVAAASGRHAGPTNAKGIHVPVRVDVLIPGRNEAAVIRDVIADLGRQAPASGFRVTVLNDRSADETGPVARAAIDASGLSDRASVVDRTTGADGKAAVLAAAGSPRPDRGLAILVLDADARLDTDFIERCRDVISAGAGAVSARRHVLTTRSRSRTIGFLTDAQGAEQAADDVIQRARTRFGGAGELRGNGMVIRADVLDALGGWPAGSLAEDLVLSTRLYLETGQGAARPAGLEIWEQAPVRVRSMLSQRLRWAEGSVRRDLDVIAPSLADARIPIRRRVDVVASSGQDLIPWFALGILTTGWRRGDGRAAAELAIGYGTAAVAIALAAPEPGISATRRVAGLIVLGGSWALVLPLAWLRVALSGRDITFSRTPHIPAHQLAPPRFRTTTDPEPRGAVSGVAAAR